MLRFLEHKAFRIVGYSAFFIVLFDKLTAAFMNVPTVDVSDYCNYTGINVSFSECGQSISDLITTLLYAITYLGGDLVAGFAA